MIGNQRLAFIGGGHITEILLHNFVGAGGSAGVGEADGRVVSPASVIVSDPLAKLRLKPTSGAALTESV